MKAKQGAVVKMNYTLRDDAGDLLDKSEEPIAYLHGYENIIPGLEKGLEGAEPGDKRQIVVEAADAYGESDPSAVFSVPTEQMPQDMEIQPGMNLIGETADGPVRLLVREVNPDNVVVDANHPLAGKRLHFDVEVLDVRKATDEELTRGAVLAA